MRKTLKQSKIYIILLNYNGWKDTIECLESLYKISYDNYQIIVVDNDSPNNSLSFIESWAQGDLECVADEKSLLKELSSPSIKKPLGYINYTKNDILKKDISEDDNQNDLILIQANENRGFAAGNNIGINYVLEKNDAEFILILNNDTVVEKDFLLPLVQKAQDNSSVGIVGSKIMHYEHPENIFSNGGSFNPWTSHIKFIHSGEKDNGQTASEVTFLSGCSWFIPISTIKEVGLLDEKYFMYVEDIDFTQKVLSFGKKLLVASDSKIYHKGARSSGGGTSDFSLYWINKNLARYILNKLTTLQKVSAIAYFFYNTLKALAKSILKRKKPNTLIEVKSFFEGLNDRNFTKETH